MRYSLEIDIDLPRDKVIELFDNPHNMKHWQEGFIDFEHLSGERGQPGAKSRLKYKMGNKEVEMIETVTVRNLPTEFSGTYEAENVWNECKNFFSEKEPGKTHWHFETEFRFHGLMMKTMGFLFPDSFRKQSYKFMKDFKTFAESTVAERRTELKAAEHHSGVN
ncbi:MAG: SRPBCC family protein [Planctomycetes bacterium]|nr:SRPBCC family protein [Planctomycetota bacterium]